MEIMSSQEYIQKIVLELGFEDAEINRLVANSETLDIKKVHNRATKLHVFLEGESLDGVIEDAADGTAAHNEMYPDSPKAERLLKCLDVVIPYTSEVNQPSLVGQSLAEIGFEGMLRPSIVRRLGASLSK